MPQKTRRRTEVILKQLRQQGTAQLHAQSVPHHVQKLKTIPVGITVERMRPTKIHAQGAKVGKQLHRLPKRNFAGYPHPLPNMAFERDAPRAARPSTLR